ncbi:MAG: acyl carrier protein [Planctomycetes bacterium]|nr:acyl carrier protein [Planctomycetota bacterium]
MNRGELKAMMAELFRCDVNEIQDTTGPGDVTGWDSLGHVALMMELQNRLGVHIPVEDALEIASVSDLVRILDRIGSDVN